MEVTVVADLDKEPVTVAQAANWCRVAVPVLTLEGDLTEEGETVLLLIQTAREWCERYTGLSFGEKTLQVRLSQRDYAGPESLPQGPNVVVTSVTDQDGNTIPAEQFSGSWYAEYLKGMSVNDTVKDDYGDFYAGTYGPEDTYTIEYTAGFAEGKLPAPLKQAILKTVNELYNNRENSLIGSNVEVLPLDAKALMDQYRKISFS